MRAEHEMERKKVACQYYTQVPELLHMSEYMVSCTNSRSSALYVQSGT